MKTRGVDVELSFMFQFKKKRVTTCWIEFMCNKDANPQVPFAVLLSDVPMILIRIMYEIAPHVLVSVIPDLTNKILVRAFNLDEDDLKVAIDRALEKMRQSVIVDPELRITVTTDTDQIDDPITRCSALDSHIQCYLEDLGYVFLHPITDPPMIVDGLTTASFAITDMHLHTAASSVKQMTFYKNALSLLQSNLPKEQINSLLKGSAKIIDFKMLKDALEKEQIRAFEQKGSVRLDSVVCTVLPRLTTAYAVEYTKSVPQELRNYWRYVHGMTLNIESCFRVSFTAGNEEATLTYPSQCVLQPHSFIPLPLRHRQEYLDKCIESLRDSMKVMWSSLPE